MTAGIANWDGLTRELDKWIAGPTEPGKGVVGRRATLWWRDDDATGPSPALGRLMRLRRDYDLPLTLAVIPARADARLVASIEGERAVTPVQHGFAHQNHAPSGAKNGELGPARPIAANCADLAAGARRMRELFGTRSVSVLVPPWNRIDRALIAHLPGLGFHGLSTFGPRAAAEPVAGLGQANTHIDIVDWRGGRGFVGEAKALAVAIEHLKARRTAAADPDEPTGLLTHHLAHDDACWRFLERFFETIAAHPGARWLAAEEIFAPDGSERYGAPRRSQ
ncbi:MAG TPA: polysaccharide deacetylase family protein [Alphaproteobacteria bacterium]|nr:polysaccharide deacetylase family protein [Alphaproteobacteria bacterium]